MGLFFEDSPDKDIKKPKIFVAIETILLIGIIVFIVMGFTHAFYYFGISWLLVSLSFGIDAIYYYKVEDKWDKSTLFTVIVFLLSGILFLIG